MTPIEVRAAKRDQGFTLVELLVVVIVIGILAAIAIPTFLAQRERGWQAEVTSAVRNAAMGVEAVAASNDGVYPRQGAGTNEIRWAELNAFFALDGTDMDWRYQESTGGVSFTMCGSHPRINGGYEGNRVRYDSTAGGVQPFEDTVGCP